MMPSLSEMLQDFPVDLPAEEQVAWLQVKLAEFHGEMTARVSMLEARQEDVERRVEDHEMRIDEHARRLSVLEQQVAAARRGEFDIALLEGLDPDLSTRH